MLPGFFFCGPLSVEFKEGSELATLDGFRELVQVPR